MKALTSIEKERRAVTEALCQNPLTGPQARYDVEFSTADELTTLTGLSCSFDGTHYWFDSPVLETEFLRSVVEPTNGGLLLEAGSGNGALIKKLIELGVDATQITGVDISRKAVERVRATGAKGIQGTIQVAKARYERILLSYFVDRDCDQKGTFKTASELLTPNGLVVLEGWFPCIFQDSTGILHGIANVTKGKNKEEDIGLVINEFARLGLSLQIRTDGTRNIYSMDGPEEDVPSTVLVFRKN